MKLNAAFMTTCNSCTKWLTHHPQQASSDTSNSRISGVLTDIQNSFNIKDDQGGLLQTVFIISYMIFAPISGYLGDRFSRKVIMAFSIVLWGASTFLGSFTDSFGWFVTSRALVGLGEGFYSTIAPTIFSDLFVHDLRSKMLALFYFAIPVGSGMG